MKAHIYYDASHVRNYDKNGIDKIELLPGTHDEVHAFKYFMKAGSVLRPELYADRSVLYVFDGTNSAGLVTDAQAMHKINSVCFYVPDYDKMSYTIQAITDMEFIMVTANMDSHDREAAENTRLHLPFYRREDQCDRYDQDCKTLGMTSRTVLFGEFDRLGRLTVGICQGKNGCGTVEKGHPQVHQWNYAVGNADYQLSVGSGDETERYDRKAGDWDFIPAGPDHSLYAGYGQEVHYVWVEFNTSKRGH